VLAQVQATTNTVAVKTTLRDKPESALPYEERSRKATKLNVFAQKVEIALGLVKLVGGIVLNSPSMKTDFFHSIADWGAEKASS